MPGAPSRRCGNAPARGVFGSYSTTFLLTETPISEGAEWRSGLTHGLDWTDVVTSSGRAYGTQDGSGSPEFNDSVACLSGFRPNHKARAVVHKAAGITGIQEVELLLRWSIDGHVIHGYECLWAHDGAYSGIVRWDAATPNGTGIGDGFVSMVGGDGPSGFSAMADGDIVEAQIVGNTISAWRNGVFFMGCDITGTSGAVYTTGNPGMGFFRKNNGGSTNPQSYCYDSFDAWSI